MANHVGKIPQVVLHKEDQLRPSWMDAFVFNPASEGYLTTEGSKGSHTSTQPITPEGAVSHVGQRSFSFVDDFYNRIIIEPSHIDVGNLVSEQFYEISVFNGYFDNKELQTLSIQDGDGVQITGPVPPSIWGPLETKQYQITIGTDGPPSVNAQLLFDFEGSSDDIIIGIVGSRIVMLPYQAEAPWSETLEWKTNVLTSNSGLEQRIKLRKKPRQSVNANYPIPPEYNSKAFNMFHGWLQRSWAVALWSEIQYVGTILPGATSINCVTFNYDFRPDSLVCLWQSNDLNEVIEVESVFSNSISLKRVLAGGYDNVYLMPVRIGIAKGGIGRQSNGYSSVAHIEYEFKDNIEITSTAPAQYLGYDIYFEDTLMPGDIIEDKFIARMDIVDFDTGVVDYFPPWQYNRRSRNAQFINETAEETWNFRKWLHRRAGRLRPYWLPTFENNLRLKMQGNVASSLLCYADDYKNLGNAHNHLAIEYMDGSWRAAIITGASSEAGEMMNVGIDLNLNVDATFIKRLSFLTLHRLDTDRIDIEHIGNSVSMASIRILEIKP